MQDRDVRYIRFGTFEVCPAAGELRKAGRVVRVQELPFRVLISLLEKPGEVVTRAELCQKLWGDTNVEFEDGLNTAVRKLREALGDSASNPRFVETLPRRGYRFIAPVTLETPTSQTNAPAAPLPYRPQRRRNTRRALMASIVVAAGLAVLGWGWTRGRQQQLFTPGSPRQLTRDSGLTTDPVISPDGRLLTYASDRESKDLDIWIQHVSEGNTRRLVTAPGDDHQPDISPDGATVAYRSERDGGGIYTIPLIGGEIRLLIPRGSVPKFSPDGSEISYSIGTTGTGGFWGRLHVFSRAAGVSRELAPELLAAGPAAWSPDGSAVVFAGAPRWTEAPSLWICSRMGGPATRMSSQPIFDGHPLGTIGTHSIAWFDGHIIVSMRRGDSSNIWAAPVSSHTNSLTGSFQRVTYGSGNEWLPSVSSTGKLVFASHEYTADVWEIAPATSARETSMRRLTQGRALNYRPSLSADGKQLVYLSNRSGNFDVWKRDLSTGAENAITDSELEETAVAISRDGRLVALGDGEKMFVVPSTGGVPKLVADKYSRPYDWSMSGVIIGRDGSREPAGAARIASWHPVTGVRTVIADHPSLITISPQVSPDGAWITFHTSDHVNRQVIAASYDGAPIPESKWIPVTDGRSLDREPRWSSDGNSVYFLSDRDGFRCVWARNLKKPTKEPIGPIYPVVHLHSARLSLKHVPDSGHVSVCSLAPKLILSIGELTGNIWMTDLKRD